MRPAPALQTIARGYSLLSPFNANGCSRCCGTRMFTSSLRNNTGQNTRQREALHLVILGAPGAGKGTHTDSLLRSYVIQALVAGNLLREQVSSKTEIGLKAAKIMKEGGLLDDATVLQVVKPSLDNLTGLDWILDGYPRTAGQARDLDEALAHNSERINLVVNLDVPDEVLIDRIENRWVHLPSGRIYNTTYNPPKAKGLDDLTGEPLSKRIDDDVDIFKKRLINFHKENAPIKDYYQNQGSLVNLSGRTSKAIWPKIVKVLDDRFPNLPARRDAA